MGQTLEKTYNATLRKLVDKVDGEKLKEKLSKLNIIEYMKAPDVPTGVKITYTPPKTTRLSERGGEPQMPIPAVPPTGRINPPWHEPVIAKVTGEPQVPIGEPPTGKPVRIRREEAGEVTGEAVGQPVTDPFTSITSDKEEYKGTEQA
jgi:hypothetical protein